MPYLDRARRTRRTQVRRAQRPAVRAPRRDPADRTSAPTRTSRSASFGPDEALAAAPGGRRRDAAARRCRPRARRSWPTRSRCGSTSTPRPTRTPSCGSGSRLEEEWYGASDLDVLGEGGHAVALWLAEGDAWAVTLAGADRAGRAPRCAACSSAATRSSCPPRTARTWSADYLPRLHRHVPVISSDGSVAVPETAEPRLVLAVTWVAADEVGVAWTWRYRVGGDDRVYRLSETRGLRGVRRPEDEQALLDALVLDDEQVYHLCRGRQRDLGLEDGGAFRDAHAVLFAEQLLPGLRGQVEIEEIGDQPRLPGDRRHPGGPLRHPGGRRRRPHPHRLARPGGGGHRRRHPDLAGPRAGGADQGDGPGRSCAAASTCASTGPSSPTWPGWWRRPPSSATSPTARSGSGTTTWACGTSSPRWASSTRRPPGGSARRRRSAPWTRCPRSTRSG